jgi:probable rRNA maturation factor
MISKPKVTVQKATKAKDIPTQAQFRRWVAAALEGQPGPREVTIRIVDDAEGAALNRDYRHKDYPTNVLAFPAGLPKGLRSPLLGDLVLCAPVIRREALAQGKPQAAHWAHLTVHGTLHLLGYDHETPSQAQEMEFLETRLVTRLGFPDPYKPQD